MGLYQIIRNSTNLNIYSSSFWNFVSGPQRTMCSTDCQDNTALYQDNSKMFIYGFSVINNANMIIEGDSGNMSPSASRADNVGQPFDGFNTGVIAAYLKHSG